MASYRSDYIFSNHLDENALVLEWADVLFKNKNLDYSEKGYIVSVFCDGIQVWNDNCSCYDFPYFEDKEIEDGYEESFMSCKNAAIANIEKIYERAFQAAQILYNNEQERKAKELAANQHTQEAVDKVQRRLEFERLKKEFE